MEFFDRGTGFTALVCWITGLLLVGSFDSFVADYGVLLGCLPRNLSTLLNVKLQTASQFAKLFGEFLGEVGAFSGVCIKIE